MTVHLPQGYLGFNPEISHQYRQEILVDGLKLEKAPLFIKNDPEIVKQAVIQNGLSLRFASDDCRNNPDIVLAACRNNPNAFEFASPNLKQSQEFIFELIQSCDVSILAHAHPFFRKNPKIAHTLLEINPAVYGYLSEMLTGYVSFNIEAVLKNHQVYDFLGEEYKSNPEFLNLLCFQDEEVRPEIFDFVLQKLPQHIIAQLLEDPSSLKELGAPYEDNAAIAHMLCGLNVQNLEFVSHDLRNNASFMRYLIQTKDNSVLAHCSEYLRNNDQFTLEAVTYSASCLVHCSERIKEHSRIHSLRACSVNPSTYSLCVDVFKNDSEIAAIAFLGDHFIRDEIPDDVFERPDFWSIILHVRQDYLMLCPEKCLSSSGFWLDLLRLDIAFLPLCPKSIIQDVSFRKQLSL